MEEATLLIVPLLTGCLLGILYFGGLWETVRRIPGSRRPYRLLVWSYLGRLSIVLGGFYLVMDGAWERLAACVAGFLAVRVIMIRGLGQTGNHSPKGVTAWKS